MSGSRKTFKYDLTDDNSGLYRLYNADESNLEALVVPGGAYADADGTIYDFKTTDIGDITQWMVKSKRYFRPRTATFLGADGIRKRTIIIPSKAMYDDLFNRVEANVNTVATFAIDGGTMLFQLADLTPQFLKFPVSTDTGLTDGDLT